MVEAASQTTCYDYDPDNNLTKVRTGKNVNNASNVINANTYRSDGQRISKTEGNVKTNYFYQGRSVLYTKNGSGNRTSFNLYSPDGGIIASKRYEGSQNNRYISYVKDIRTSTSTLIDEDGGYLSSYKYSDFGETVRANNTNILNEICYTGGIYDTSTSMYYLNSRYYDPWKSNFISQDTYRGEKNDPGTWNLYAYCADNPINYTDPSGHWGSSVHYTDTKKWAKEVSKKITEDIAHHIAVACNGVDFAPETNPFKKNKSNLSWHYNINSSGDSRLNHMNNNYKAAISIITKKGATSNDKHKAYKLLGQGLHALQDYYAHKEWNPNNGYHMAYVKSTIYLKGRPVSKWVKSDVFDNTSYDITIKGGKFYGTKRGGYGSRSRYLSSKLKTKYWIGEFSRKAKLI